MEKIKYLNKIHHIDYPCGIFQEVSFDIAYRILVATTDINKATCPKCVYFYYHPEARVLEQAYGAGRL